MNVIKPCGLSLLLFLPTICSSRSKVPSGLDPTVQVFQATAAPVDPGKPNYLTSIQSGQNAQDLLNSLHLKLTSAASCVGKQAIVVHTADWRVVAPKTGSGDYSFNLESSQWTGFHAEYKNGTCVLSQSFRADKNPRFYGDESVYFVGINYFADENGGGIDPSQLQLGYKISTTASTPQNIQDLGTLVAALVGVTVPTVGVESVPLVGGSPSAPANKHFFVLEQPVATTSAAPFTINVTLVLQPATSTLPAAVVGQAYRLDLSGRAGRGKTISTVANLPPGMQFDTNSGVLFGTPRPPTPGDQTLQVQITEDANPANSKSVSATLPLQATRPANTANNTQTQQTSTTSPAQPIDCSNVSAKTPCTFTRNFPVDDKEYWDVSLSLAIPGPKERVFKASSGGAVPSSSTTTHTDAYAMADGYFLAHWWDKQAPVPHANAGVPITSQSLHRPYVGISEDITGWAQRHGFPLDICLFGGVVFMKQQLYDPKALNGLRTDWARKAMYGVEVPISGIASKLSGKGSKASSSKGSAGQ